MMAWLAFSLCLAVSLVKYTILLVNPHFRLTTTFISSFWLVNHGHCAHLSIRLKILHSWLVPSLSFRVVQSSLVWLTPDKVDPTELNGKSLNGKVGPSLITLGQWASTLVFPITPIYPILNGNLPPLVLPAFIPLNTDVPVFTPLGAVCCLPGSPAARGCNVWVVYHLGPL